MDILTYALAKGYTDKALLGAGAIKGAPCTVKSQTEDDEYVYVTLGWENSLGTSEETVVKIKKGADGAPGEPGPAGDPGPRGVSITKIEKIKTEGLIDTYQISFSDNTTFEYTVSNGSDAIIDDNEAGLAKTFSSDKITKTFATLEEANKRIPQYDVLPAPTEACKGQVVQFTGTTTEDYVHNYFYECVQVEGSYRWVNIVVQNVPTKVSELTNDSNFVTETELNEKGYLTEHQDISGKVDKEEGKSLIADSEITRLSTVKNYDDSVVKEDIATIKTDYATKTYVGEQIASADHLKREIVTEVPTAETAAENVIYMLKVESAIGADKYKEYMLIDGEVACVGDTSVDLTDYAKKSEIPTELPANGGNADTVNTHTVASDVPENAVFTDTIYDDTDVQKIISDNGYGEVAGGKNLFPHNTEFSGNSENIFIFPLVLDVGSYIVSCKNKQYGGACQFIVDDEAGKSVLSSTSVINFDAPGRYSVHLNVIKKSATIRCYVNSNEILYDIQIEKGAVATEYEPYFPSNKMLAEENSQQSAEMMDIKMLGWSVPRKCPVQNEVNGNQFIQKVGRVDLGSLDWNLRPDGSFENHLLTSLPVGTTLDESKEYAVYSNLYESSSWDVVVNNNVQDMVMTLYKFYSWSYATIAIRNKAYTDVASFKKAMQSQYLYYELTTPITTIIDGNEIGETVGNVRKETTVNLLNPILETTTKNGITCTNNGDGTYTLNGIKTADTIWLQLGTVSLKANTSYKLIGQSPTDTSTDVRIYDNDGINFGDGTYKGVTPIITPTTDLTLSMQIRIAEKTTLNNFIVKPMITTNLDATYDDFVPYTGNTGGLNSDVAEIRNEVSQQSAKINSNTTSLLGTVHKVYSMEVGKSAVEPVVISDFKIEPGYRYLYIINGSGTTGYEVGILMFINGMKFVPLSSSSGTAMKDSVSAIGIDIYIENGQLKVSRSATSYAATCVIYKLG